MSEVHSPAARKLRNGPAARSPQANRVALAAVPPGPRPQATTAAQRVLRTVPPLPRLRLVPAVEPGLQVPQHAKRCACVARTVMAYRDEDGDPSCTRCGRQLATPTTPVRSGSDELARRRAVA